MRTKLKYVVDIVNGATPSTAEPDYWDGSIEWATPDDLGKLTDKYIFHTTRKITDAGLANCGASLSPKGSILLSTRAPIGHIAISQIPICCNQGCRILKPTSHIETSYMYYCLSDSKACLNALGQGSTFVELSRERLAAMQINLPPIEEQKAIVSFLDRETSRIDALIQKKERLIELLKEKRIALITQAVTKGLDPNVPMKDSGIEWLGEVPEHWDIKKLKHVSTYMVSNVDKKTQEGETTIRLFNYTDVYNNEFLTNEMDLMVASAPPGQLDNFIVYTDDVLITKDSEDWKDIAKPALVKSTAPDILCGYHLAMIRPIRGISTGKFLFRALQSTLINQQFQIASNGVTRYGLPKSAIGESLITLPSIKEQHEIASHIDQETSKIDNLTSKIISSITLLREYRSSLINAAVTGKIDLREAL